VSKDLADAVQAIAERERRSVGRTAQRLVGEAVQGRDHRASQSPLPQTFDEVESIERRNSLRLRLPEGMRAAIKALAVTDDRPMASMAVILLAEALAARDVHSTFSTARADAPIGIGFAADDGSE